MSGIFVDYVNALGEALGLKIEWTQEINLSTYIEDLKNGRYDLECSGGWPNARRGMQLQYSTPVYYQPLIAVARKDDSRFNNNYKAINQASTRIATQDGATTATVRERRFPGSTNVALPQAAPYSDTLMAVATNKADLTFVEVPMLSDYNKSNPDNKLQRVEGPPIRLVVNALSMPIGDTKLKLMLDTATQELIHDGVIDRILDKYEEVPGTYLRVAPPYIIDGD